MFSLLLLTAGLLLAHLTPGVTVNSFLKIDSISLSIEPHSDVTRGTNVTLRCGTVIRKSGEEALSREYIIYKDSTIVYTKNTSSSEDLLYPLNEVRVSNRGKYTCSVQIQDKALTSEGIRMVVRGLSTPQLQLDKAVVTEGEELRAWCTAPGETGSLTFYFYVDSKEIKDKQVNTNQAEVNFHLTAAGNRSVHCSYSVLGIESNRSDTVTVSVEELDIRPVLEISPLHEIYEGDELTLSCAIKNNNMANVELYLFHGMRFLKRGYNRITDSMIMKAEDTGQFECQLEMGKVKKNAKKLVSVRELFSKPTLTVSPAEVFEGDSVTLTCKSESFAFKKIRKEDLTYSLDLPGGPMSEQGRTTGLFHGIVPTNASNYTCAAAAKGIKKSSSPLIIRPKVHASTPNISVMERAVLGRAFRILCKSDIGSLPINYTLLKDHQHVGKFTVRQAHQLAYFTVTIHSPEEMNQFLCMARNSDKNIPLSSKLKATIIRPLSHPTLTVIPVESEISEGDHLYLICGVKGSPPVTFKWYMVGDDQLLFSNTSDRNTSNYQIKHVTTEHSGTYICEAINYANNVVRSAPVVVSVRLALWKKGLIGGSLVLLVSVLAVVAVLCFKNKRGKRETAAELSVKPSSPKSDDTLAETLTLNNEVHNAAPANRTEVSVWTERLPGSVDGEESSVMNNEPDVEYTEVVHPQPADPARVPLRKGTDTVYSELQNSDGADDRHGYGPEEVELATNSREGEAERDVASELQSSEEVELATAAREGEAETDNTSELQNSEEAELAADDRESEAENENTSQLQGSVEYAELNSDRPEPDHFYPDVNANEDLPVPVD